MKKPPLTGDRLTPPGHAPADQPRMRIDLIELETFLTVAELQSFSAAARKLHLSQPSVSARVQRLEAALGVQLLIRTTRQVRTTQSGARLQLEAEKTLADLRLLTQRFKAETSADRLRVSVAATPMLAAVALPPLIRSYAQSHPHIVVSLHDLDRSEALEFLASGEADFAVMSLDGEHPELHSEPWMTDEIVVIAPLGHPLLAGGSGGVTLDEVVRHPVVLAENERFVRRAIEGEYARRGVPLQPAFKARGIANLLRMVAEGMGISFVPASLIPRELRSALGVAALLDFHMLRHYAIVTLAKARMAPAAAEFSHFLRSAQGTSALTMPSDGVRI